MNQEPKINRRNALGLFVGSFVAGCGGGTVDTDIRSRGTYFSYSSDAGDWVGGGNSGTITRVESDWFAVVTRNKSQIIIRIGDRKEVVTFTSFSMNFAAPTGDEIRPGKYPLAKHPIPEPSATPSMDVVGFARGSNTLLGEFTIHELAYDTTETSGQFHFPIQRLFLTFSQHSDESQDRQAQLHGELSIGTIA